MKTSILAERRTKKGFWIQEFRYEDAHSSNTCQTDITLYFFNTRFSLQACFDKNCISENIRIKSCKIIDCLGI